ncbi:MAG: asparagine synthase (glutamine-hydrolyzing) [bacterium]
MCGIAGIAYFDTGRRPDARRVRAMCQSILYRGPDEEGIDISGSVALGMRRLSIIDVAGGSQPIFNETKTVRVVYNGEIYNYRELREKLQQRGHEFATKSDTEVIVHAYEEYGADFPKHLNGMFAIALHDSRLHTLILARDHIGIKPLYYSFAPDRIVWGSEIKALLASGEIARQLDTDALAEYMAWEYIPGERTLLKGVLKLEPASILVIDLGRPACNPFRYWDVPPQEKSSRSEEDWIDAIDAKLKACVQRQMVSDVPLGAFLSGGVDSSLLVAGMGKASTFSIGFDDPSYSEVQWSSRVASHLGVSHTTEILKPDILDLFGRLITHMDDPIGDFSIFPTYLVSMVARKHVTVALSGDGGDELFGGYETYLADDLAQRAAGFLSVIRPLAALQHLVAPRPAKKGLVNKLKRFAEGLQHPDALCHARWRLFAGESLRQQLFTADALKSVETPVGAHILRLLQDAGPRDHLNRSLYVDLKSYLVDNCLVKVDRMSMAVSLESRVPYLDREMVELAFQVPGSLKLKNRETKSILKKVAVRHVPAQCVYRPKEGFSIPIKKWLCTTLRPLMEDTLSTSRINSMGVFNPVTVNRLKDEHLSGRANNSHILWSMIMFMSWHRKWMEQGDHNG